MYLLFIFECWPLGEMIVVLSCSPIIVENNSFSWETLGNRVIISRVVSILTAVGFSFGILLTVE
jgi:hypothetical protein